MSSCYKDTPKPVYPFIGLQIIFLTATVHHSAVNSLCCQWLERIAKISEAGVLSPSLTLSISCQSSLPITVPVHSQSVYRTLDYLIPILLLTILHLSISTCTSSSITPVLMLNCNYFHHLLPTSLLLHILYIIIFIWCYSLYVCLCVTLCCCLCRTALLYLGQVAVVNETLSTGLPG
jgi:hypothetical protein